MIIPLEFSVNRICKDEVANHLMTCDNLFIPPLSKRVTIDCYADKIISRAVRFEAVKDKTLVGLAAAYCNDTQNLIAFITSVSVLPQWQGRGIASQLIKRCIDHIKSLGFVRIELEADRKNLAAINLYMKNGFLTSNQSGSSIMMHWKKQNAQ